VFSTDEETFSPETPRPGPNFHEQDSLYKFNLCSTERANVLSRLDSYNLNAFSLFDSDEALMETMWSRMVPTLARDLWIDSYREDGEGLEPTQTTKHDVSSTAKSSKISRKRPRRK
jgi:hypothetical protein